MLTRLPRRAAAAALFRRTRNHAMPSLQTMFPAIIMNELPFVRHLSTPDLSRAAAPPSRPTTIQDDVQYISFYKYTVVDAAELPRLRKSMLDDWRRMGVLGRVYIAEEGINAQITVPAARYFEFREFLQAHAHPIFRDVFFNSGGKLNDDNTDRAPFHTLHVRVRPHLAADGLTTPLDMSKRGQELTPREWHGALDDGRPKRILDCRNYYEHDVGRFEHAERIMVETFKETFDTLDAMLAETPKDTPCMIYCTGGIRCEKVGAYLTQQGFTDVMRLEGGIVHYAAYVKEHAVESKFKGRNFVFDQRLSNDNTAITDDVLAHCYTCGAPCNTHTNCSNTLCHGLILQCAACATTYDGACSIRCQNMMHSMRHLARDARRAFSKQYAYQFQHHLVPNGRIRPGLRATPHRPFSTYRIPPSNDVDAFVVNHGASAPHLDVHRCQLHQLRTAIDRDWSAHTTAKMIPDAQALYLQFLIRSLGATSVLEIGCFTGYSALAMALAPAQLTTCDVDAAAVAWTRAYWAAHDDIPPIDVRHQDGLALVDELGLANTQFDFIFVDGNKASYTALYDAILDRGLLKPKAMLVFDNTLFRSQVIEHALGRGHAKEKIAAKLTRFNDHVQADSRTRSFVLPLWDGMTMVQWA
ncbi:Aste57867_17453 [Aphanomyces stellatus]|uniref:Aste57867_17453 protein n=1 Tax=Aphanomyces stellatus TaxID=120398 RepID=A0A485L9M5_9STRA|nr:hypothetical protein As57867_017393 [Aphanomyces stellatus]VFT94207.1 Aste57867_17453 [Aphanomyces stellatus]